MRLKALVVGSGKGGTGKTTTATLIATHLTKYFNVGLLDADLSCPSIGKMFGLTDYVYDFAANGKIEPVRWEGITEGQFLEVFSLGGDIPDDQFVAWRGSQLRSMLKEQFTSVDWGDIDVLVVDLPPSTSDSVQTVLETCGNATVVPVTINTELGISDTRKFLSLVRSKKMIISGLLLNMADVYDSTYTEDEIEEILKLTILARIAFDKSFNGKQAGLKMLANYDDELADLFRGIVA